MNGPLTPLDQRGRTMRFLLTRYASFRRALPGSSRWTLAAAFAAASLLTARSGLAQDVTEGYLKGAFIYNFANFTEWPAEVLPAGAPLVACVVGDNAVASALARNAKGRPVAGHNFVVTTPPENGLQGCHLLYVSAASTRLMSRAVTSLGQLPVLTISDIDEFARAGGIAQFFVEGGKMRFRVNLASVKRSRLHLSSKLLSLADLVND